MLKNTLALLASLCFSMNAVAATNQDVVTASNDFGVSVFQSLVKKEATSGKNILYSPMSMNSAISMVGHFARPSAQKALLNSMGLEMGYTAYSEAIMSIYEKISTGQTDKYQVKVANSFWVDAEFPLSQSNRAVNALSKYYGAEVENSLLFSDARTADAMNQWVSDNTDKKITQLVKADDVLPLDWAAINAVVMDAKWFSKLGKGWKAPFTSSKGNSTDVEYMEASNGLQSLTKPGYKVWEVPYGERDQKKGSFIILQPEDPAGLTDLVNTLSGDMIADLKADLDEQSELGNFPYVNLQIPAFKLDYETGKKEIEALLVEGGAAAFFSAFDMNSLHYSFTADNQNRIKVIKQKAVITVANEGTVAAAASFVGGGIESMGPETVLVDSAFVYVIMDEATGSVLFVGTLDDASQIETPEMN